MDDMTGSVRHSPIIRISVDVGSDHGEQIYAAVRDAAGSIPVFQTGPTGIASIEPLLLVTDSGRTAFFYSPSPSAARELAAELASSSLPMDRADAVVEHDPDISSLPVPDAGPLSVGRRHVLGPCGWADPLVPADYDLYSSESHDVAAAATGIHGRGRGDAHTDEPVTDAWELAGKTDGDPVVVVNANEPDDRPRVDRTLLAGAPIAVLDGVAAVASAVGAEDVVIYLNEHETALQQHVRRAVDAAADELPLDPDIVTGPDEYRAGAPTPALEAMEGADRIEPRRQPPTPAEYGLYGRPTIIHTPRTFAQVQRTLIESVSSDADGSEPGTRLVTVTGDVETPAIVELDPSMELVTARKAVSMNGEFKMACVGGVFGGITADLDVVSTASSLAAAGLGTDGVIELLNDERCVVATVGERAKVASDENSGRCVPGREGTAQLVELLREVYQGSYRNDDIRELGRVMEQSSNCQIGAHAPRPVVTAMNEFEPEFREHADGQCPSGACTESL